jgi:hypothetical protein
VRLLFPKVSLFHSFSLTINFRKFFRNFHISPIAGKMEESNPPPPPPNKGGFKGKRQESKKAIQQSKEAENPASFS